MRHFKTTTRLLTFLCSFSLAAQGQVTLSLEDLSGFNPQVGNWAVVGEVAMDPSVEVHPEEEPSKKSKKNKRTAPQAVSFTDGTGILLNLNTPEKKDHLVTQWEHGDIELELEVMLPKGSNSGIYLQGRYEIQLLDSWGVKDPSFSDIGGIYRNWESDPEKAYMGKAPLINAAKAPGLWQSLKVAFKAPEFDEAGLKVENAKLLYVDLNGVRIHENVEIPRPTGGPIASNEVPRGPIMIQGDHGPVAFRNIRYRLLRESEVTLSDLSYEVYHGPYQTFEELDTATAVGSGTSVALTYKEADRTNDFGMRFNGTLNIPETGEYAFGLRFGGYGILEIGGNEVLTGRRESTGAIMLEKGSYPLELRIFKSVSWHRPYLGLTVTGPNAYPKTLHAFSSAPIDSEIVSPILIEVGAEPKLLRAFLDYRGDRSKRLTHTIGVGEPDGIHYIYDLNAGNVVCLWKGDFVDATPMWHDRGDGSFRPLGMIQYLHMGPAVAVLEDNQAAFPDQVHETFRSTGYQLDEATGRPVFFYTTNDMRISDKVYPDEKGDLFIRELTTEGGGTSAWFKLAEGSRIEQMSNGQFVIGDKQYYIDVLSEHQPMIRKSAGQMELIVPVSATTLKYTLTW